MCEYDQCGSKKGLLTHDSLSKPSESFEFSMRRTTFERCILRVVLGADCDAFEADELSREAIRERRQHTDDR